MNRLAEKLINLISQNLPGDKAWNRMMPDARGLNVTGSGLRKASVMILLFPGNKDISILLIKRTEDRGPHSGQVSLPGGMLEESDRDGAETAIREISEETGINGEHIRILGKLSNLIIPVSNIEVSPYIGLVEYRPEFKPNPAEVDYLIEIDLKSLLDAENIKTDKMIIAGNMVNVPYFHLNAEKVWGATAMILAEFIDLVEKAVQDQQVQY